MHANVHVPDSIHAQAEPHTFESHCLVSLGGHPPPGRAWGSGGADHLPRPLHTPRSPLPAPRTSYPVSSYSKRCTQVVKPGSPHHVAAYVTPAELAMWPQLNRFANEIRCMRVYVCP